MGSTGENQAMIPPTSVVGLSVSGVHETPSAVGETDAEVSETARRGVSEPAAPDFGYVCTDDTFGPSDASAQYEVSILIQLLQLLGRHSGYFLSN